MPARELRRYQQDGVDRLRAAFRQHQCVLYQLATGGGKTMVFSHITDSANARGHRVLILVHLRELITQASKKLTEYEVPHGIIAAGLDRDHDAPVLVASVQTLRGRQFPAGIRLIVIDEAHHSAAKTYKDILAAYPDAWVLGVTATPLRLEGKALGAPDGLFTLLVCGPSTKELIDLGFLSPVRCFAPGGIDREWLRQVHKQAGDYRMDEVEELVNRKQITGNAIDQYRLRLDHQPTIVFCVSRKHAEMVAADFAAAGYRAAYVDHKTRRDERERLIYGLGNESIEVLTNCSLISEGVDVPAVSGIIQLRPTASLVMHRQQIGRGMRPVDGKVLIVNDHVGNIAEHGLPELEPRWALQGIDRKAGDGKALVWICKADECGAINPIHRQFCEACGAPSPRKPIELPKVVDGSLQEFTLEMALARHRLSDADARRLSIWDLIKYADARHINRNWVYYRVMDKARAAKEAGKDSTALDVLREFAMWKGHKRGWASHRFGEL